MRSLRREYIRGTTGTFAVATIKQIDEGLSDCQQLLRLASPIRRRRILADADRLLDRRLEIAGGAR